jgi:hypothetical protein
MEEEEEEEDLEETKKEERTFSTQEYEDMGGPHLDLFQPQVIFDLA